MTRRRWRASALARCVADESGFSLAELLVVIVILGLMMAAVLGTLDISQKSYTRATASEDAQVGTRVAMDRLASDLRLIGSYYSGATNAGNLITAFSSSAITFWGDVNADTLTGSSCPLPSSCQDATTSAQVSAGATSIPVSSGTGFTAGEALYIGNGSIREVATISGVAGTTITVSSGLARTYPTSSLARSVEQVTYSYSSADRTITRTTAAEGAQAFAENVSAFTLTGYDSSGATTTNPAAIEAIAVSLTTQASAVSRTMTVRVDIRNAGL